VVDEDLARALIRDQFPEVATDDMRSFGAGWDNTAWLVDGIVFRFPRREIAVQLMKHEMAALPALAPYLPLGVPVPAWHGHASARFDWPFAGYRHLAGATACSLDLDDDARAALARPLGEFLRALHGIKPTAVKLPADEWERTNFVRRVDTLRERLQALREAGLIDDAAEWLAVFEEPHPPAAARLTPVHGDLYSRHVLVGDDGQPCGVIDWGDVHLGDRALDLSVMYSLLPASARPAFEGAYGPLDERTRRMAQLRATFSATMVAAFGHDIGDADLVREGRRALDLVLQR
jgi:aminoglycoside phosphotransferase (APT) family kinase protein